MIKYAVVIQTKTVGNFSFELPRIVVKDEWDIIVAYTEYDQYILREGRRIKGASSTVEIQAAKYVVMLLNFVLGLGKALNEITMNDLQKFLDWYCAGHGTEKQPGLQSVNNCRSHITSFIAELARRQKLKFISEEDLYVKRQTYSSKRRKKIERKIMRLQVRSFSASPNSHFTDLPLRSVFDLIELSSQYDPMLTLAICCGAWAGMRSGEIVNMKTLNSSFGAGLLVTRANNKTHSITIDITSEHLRTKEQKKTGEIKRPRLQRVLPEFVDPFLDVLERHIGLLEKVKNNDKDAMFLNKQGYAMTDEVYRQRFAKLVNERFVPFLLLSPKDEYQIAGQLIQERGMTPHALRHWFSTYLALLTDKPYVIAEWRGDRSTDAAITYLQNKGILEAQLQQVVSKTQDQLLYEGANFEVFK